MAESRWAVAMRGAALAAGLGVVGCGSSPTGPQGSKAPDYSGAWRGTTSEGETISFSVAGQQVTEVSVRIRVSMGFNSGTCAYTFASKAPVSLAGAAFEVPVETASGIVYKTVVRGSFGSGSAASGSIDNFSVSGMSCGGRFTIGSPVAQGTATWSAARQ